MVDYHTKVRKFISLYDIVSSLPVDFAIDGYCQRQNLLIESIDIRLKESGVKSVVMEEYVDRHYIHDFCGHYGSCYHDYPKKCIRVHFFSYKFSEAEFKRIITDLTDPQDAIAKLGEYIGFIIFRPLPSAIFGNVALKAPVSSQNLFLITKTIKVHLCGLELYVATIPFQEQDKAISACATSALWTALHAIQENMPHNVPSPHRLTEKARKALVEGVKSHEVTRGLTITQMSWAAKDDNISPIVCVPPSTSYLKALLRAYLYARIPVVLGIQLFYNNDDVSKNVINKVKGHHAVTALGYGEDLDYMKPFDAPDMVSYNGVAPRELFLESSSLNAIFCHDDQIGPFSLMTVPDEYSPALTTEWGRKDPNGSIDAKVLSILIPCNNKVRIRFSKIYDLVKGLNLILADYYTDTFGYQISWDIRLETVCHLKSRLRSIASNILDPASKFKILSTPMPRYIWVVDQYIRKASEFPKGRDMVVSYFFDATDIENSDFLMKVVHYRKVAYNFNKAFFMLNKKEHDNPATPYIIRNLTDCYIDKENDKIIVSSSK